MTCQSTYCIAVAAQTAMERQKQQRVSLMSWMKKKDTLREVEPPTLKVNSHSQSEARDVQKLTVVSDQSVLMKSRVCVSTEGLEKVTPEKDISLEGQDCVQNDVEMMPPVKEYLLNEEQSFCSPTEGVKEVCKHDVVTSAISSMDRCAECVGPVAALKWIGLRCKLCSSFWHKSCYTKFHKWTRKQSSLMRSVLQILMPVILMRASLRMMLLLEL
ncbi:uncharacterized protein LOC127655021 [Xyrauchen texanus]|uniref:uncharacterized protein LOC127655021 n=1 Tax=Xyrauchen texanus TaxID=154827 RepID=UPI0022426198|nr:uncharacterized protein LOC127655021 [Xyrauchen texanus]